MFDVVATAVYLVTIYVALCAVAAVASAMAAWCWKCTKEQSLLFGERVMIGFAAVLVLLLLRKL